MSKTAEKGVFELVYILASILTFIYLSMQLEHSHWNVIIIVIELFLSLIWPITWLFILF